MNNKNFWKEIIGDLEHSTEEIFKYFGYIKNEEDIKRIEEINSLIGNIKNYVVLDSSITNKYATNQYAQKILQNKEQNMQKIKI